MRKNLVSLCSLLLVIWVLAIILNLAMFFMPNAFAEDGHNVADQLGNILSGKNEEVEFWPYVAYTTKGTTSLFGIPVIPKNLRFKGSTRMGQEDWTVKLEIGLEL